MKQVVQFTLWLIFVSLAGWGFGKLGSPLGNDADHPLRRSGAAGLDSRWCLLDAWKSSQVPKAERFVPPMGSEGGGLVYNAQPFWEMNEKRGGHHTGDDLNGIGGMNTDLGDPVFSVADGLVIYSGEPSPGWGKIVIIAHLTSDGRRLQSMYGHLHRIDVERDSLVARGQPIGSVGTANGYYPAHLHFEIRESDGVDIGAGYASSPLNRLDPQATLANLHRAASDDISPSPLSVFSISSR